MEGVRPTLFDGQDESKYRKKRRNKYVTINHFMGVTRY